MEAPVYIAPLAPFGDAALIDPLVRHVERTFGVEARVLVHAVSVEGAFDPVRNQYNSSTLLLRLLGAVPGGGGRILGVTDVDLFVPILTFLFGEAQFEGAGALVSTHRLHAEFHGGPPDPALLLERLLKEAAHELGHTFGLIHCITPGCVMASSTDVDGIDGKSLSHCERCRAVMRRKFGLPRGA